MSVAYNSTDFAGHALSRKVTFLGSASDTICGVMDYSRKLVGQLNELAPGVAALELVEASAPARFVGLMADRLRADGIVHLQLPINGWGNSIVPGSALAAARVLTRRGRIVISLHEWVSVHPLRLMSYIPDLMVADAFVFPSEVQRDAFQSFRLVPRRTREAAACVPVGPNISAAGLVSAEVEAEGEKIRSSGRKGGTDVVIGFFGALYSAKHSSKQPMILLETLHALQNRGVTARLVICGDFLHDKPMDAKRFEQRAEALGVSDLIDFRGSILDERRLMTVLAACDLFLLPYQDGISARRSSFQAVAQLPKPIVTTKPINPREFDRTPLLAAKVFHASTRMVDASASPEDFAQAVVEAAAHIGRSPAADLMALWRDAALEHLSLYARL